MHPNSTAVIARARELGEEGRIREAGRLLRERLVERPDDLEIRQALSQIYRDGGFLDQAGRYEIALPSSVRNEREAFIRLLAGTNADEARIRKLSVLTDEMVIPELVLTRINEVKQTDSATRPWDDLSSMAFMGFAVTALFTVVVVYFIVLLGGGFAVPVARIGGSLCCGILAVATGAGAISWAVQGWRLRAGAWAAVRLLFTAGTAIGVVVMLR